MNCPKCGSDNVSVQVIQTAAKTSQKGNGCLWSLGRLTLIICPAAPLEWRGLLSASCGRVEAVILEPYRRTAAGLPYRCHILYTIRISVLLTVCLAQFFFISHKTAADFVYNENFNFHSLFLRSALDQNSEPHAVALCFTKPLPVFF